MQRMEDELLFRYLKGITLGYTVVGQGCLYRILSVEELGQYPRICSSGLVVRMRWQPKRAVHCMLEGHSAFLLGRLFMIRIRGLRAGRLRGCSRCACVRRERQS